MKRILTPEQAQAFDSYLIHQLGLSSLNLMYNAALGLCLAVIRSNGDNKPVVSVCGRGNNGGDGVAAAVMLHKFGYRVRIILLCPEESLSNDSKHFFEQAIRLHIPCTTGEMEFSDELIIDSIFGVGLKRELDGVYADAVRKINASGCRVISADLPSGLSGLSGQVLGCAVRANETVSFQFAKPGLCLGDAKDYTGNVYVYRIDSNEPPKLSGLQIELIEREDVMKLLPEQSRASHKGKNGKALLCVGSDKYVGAALMSAKACLRAGCGLLYVATVPKVREALHTIPEAMTLHIDSAKAEIAGKNAVGIGCGIGNRDIGELLKSILMAKLPTVVDADGLNYLSRHKELYAFLHEKVVLTPHVGEMARLCDTDIATVLNDCVNVCTSFAKEYGCVVLLKGASSCISDGKRMYINTSGNAGLAKGGSGDVLTGIITALLAGGLSAMDAAAAGAYLLGSSADEALNLLKNRALNAGDVVSAIRSEVNYGTGEED